MKKGRFEDAPKDQYYDYDEEDTYRKPKRDEPRRRPVKNWKRAWQLHEDDIEDAEEFFTWFVKLH